VGASKGHWEDVTARIIDLRKEAQGQRKLPNELKAGTCKTPLSRKKSCSSTIRETGQGGAVPQM